VVDLAKADCIMSGPFIQGYGRCDVSNTLCSQLPCFILLINIVILIRAFVLCSFDPLIADLLLLGRQCFPFMQHLCS
jgi:hypothetical protein